MAVKTIEELLLEYQINFPDNTSELIEAVNSRQSFIDTTESLDALKVDNTQDVVNRWNANKLQDKDIDPTPPTNKQILVYNSLSDNWEPKNTYKSVGFILFSDNVTETTIVDDTPVLVNPTTFTSLRLVDFSQPVNGRLTYTGTETKDFVLSASLCLLAITNDRLMTIYIAKNGTIINDSKNSNSTPSGECTETSTFYIDSLMTDDYLELFVQNNENTSNITVVDAKLMVKTL